MKRGVLIFLFFVAASPLALHSQQNISDSSITDQQKLGRRVFEQRCPVCHTLITATGKTYGPTLYKDLIAGNEGAIRVFILYGSPGKMPGFKYSLEPSEIDAIIAYLKTVPKPPPARSGEGDARVD